MSLPLTAVDGGTVTLWNQARVERPLILFRGTPQAYKRERLVLRPNEQLKFEPHDYEAVRLAAGDIDHNVFDPYTKAILNAPGGIAVVANNVLSLLNDVKAGHRTLRPLRDMKDLQGRPVEDKGGIPHKYDAIAIAKTVEFTPEEIKAEIESRGATPKEGEARTEAILRTRELIGRLYDDSRRGSFSEVRDILFTRLTPKQKFDRGLISQDEYEVLAVDEFERKIFPASEENLAKKLKGMGEKQAIGIIERATIRTEKNISGLLANFKEIKQAYKEDKRPAVRAAIEKNILGRKVSMLIQREDGATSEESLVEITQENIKDLLNS